MELKRLMTQFLSKWLTSSENSVADSPQAPISILPQEIPVEGALSQAIAGHEAVARFMYNKRDFAPDGGPRPKVFMPEHGTGVWETSVCRLTACEDGRIWHLANTVRGGIATMGRADLGVEVAHNQALMVQAAPMPEQGYDEHAVVLGWPEGDSETIKSHHKMIAAVLASEAEVRQPPPRQA